MELNPAIAHRHYGKNVFQFKISGRIQEAVCQVHPDYKKNHSIGSHEVAYCCGIALASGHLRNERVIWILEGSTPLYRQWRHDLYTPHQSIAVSIPSRNVSDLFVLCVQCVDGRCVLCVDGR